ncbi:MAG: hypothetical protein KJZ86_16055 [Caldilineaceae bacterium]|nr:hypothetical protein [Caldilineaceae bacterium]HRJ45583.1 hypothetical protein [Caldilineaceae bacterium]
MDSFYAVTMILGFFLLRLGVPLLITLAVCYGLRRLDARWQAEAEAEYAARLSAEGIHPVTGG